LVLLTTSGPGDQIKDDVTGEGGGGQKGKQTGGWFGNRNDRHRSKDLGRVGRAILSGVY